MTEEELKKANGLKDEKEELERELEIWAHQLTMPSRIGYLWEGSTTGHLHFTELKSKMPVDIFSSFRMSVMNHLKLRMTEIDREILEI